MNDQYKILVLDDEPGITRITESVLSMKGYTVQKYNDPTIALSEFEQTSYSMVIVDLMMPQMSGFEFLQSVKEKHPDLLCIILSAKKLNEEERKQVFDFKAEHIVKPFKPRDLLDAVDRCIAGSR